jgi:hypothetical protein
MRDRQLISESCLLRVSSSPFFTTAPSSPPSSSASTPSASSSTTSSIHRKVDSDQRSLHPLCSLQAETPFFFVRHTPRLEDSHQVLVADLSISAWTTNISKLRHPSSNVLSFGIVIESLFYGIEDSRIASRVVANAGNILPVTPVARDVVVNQVHLVPVK